MFDSAPTRLRRLAAASLTLAACGLVTVACSDGGSTAPAARPAAQPSTAPAKTAPAEEAAKADSPAAEPTAEPVAASPAELAQRGRQVYMANCIACHSQDPSADGALGPAVAGSSYELLEARVLRAEYPEGYTPKRPSKVMIARPHLEDELEALHAYLAEAAG